MKRIKSLLIAFSLTASLSTQAAIISGAHTLSNGNAVALQGLEWLSFDVTVGRSRNDIETSGFLDTYDGGGWQYADRKQTETLINSLWGGVYDGWSSDNGSGAVWIRDNFKFSGHNSNFNNTQWTNYNFQNFLFGASKDCTALLTFSCRGTINAADNYSLDIRALDIQTRRTSYSYSGGSGALGWFADDYGGDFGVQDYNVLEMFDTRHNDLASLLVRKASITSTQVSEPSTIAIFALGLMGLGVRRFCKS